MEKIFLIRFILFLFITLNIIAPAYAELVPSKNAKLKGIDWQCSKEMKIHFAPYFDELNDKQWDPLKFKIKIDQITKELFNSGYFSSSVKMELVPSAAEDVRAKVIINAPERINFHFTGNTIFSYQELRSRLIDKIKNDFGKTDRTALEIFLNEIYEGAGFYNTNLKSYQNEGRDLDGIGLKNYFFEITEGDKLLVTSTIYRGNSALNEEDLKLVFNKNATPLALAGYYDKTFFENYADVLKKEYLSNGYIFTEISKPRITTSDDDESVTVEYGITEKQQVTLKKITLNKIDPILQDLVKKSLQNKEGQPLNITELENDLRKIINYFQNEGYYFASISNLNSDNLLVYDKTFSSAELKPEVILDRQVCYSEASVNGNTQTFTGVITREIGLTPGELITPSKLEGIRQRLSGLGLFSLVRISPYMVYDGSEKSCAKSNLVIQVKEKDFNFLELAPGYRTDLGYKVSSGVNYNNLGGMNRSAAFKIQANLRDNLNGFDDRRRKENIRKLEYLSKVSYVEPYLFSKKIEFELATSFQRKRFYGFDANVFRLSPQISKNFANTNISTSVKYQLERIEQFDATVAKDNDNFTIGGITPSITYDKRNDAINPRDGYYLNLSSEWANRYFGSMKNDDLEVNYVKFISRNKFYYPLGNFTLAFSLALGFEKNFALDLLKDSSGNVLYNSNNVPRTHGYIPSIKVFRLDGYDEIRGYDENEINRIKSGQAIGDIVVQNEAYFTAFKFEPRYNLTDSVQIGIFFDAGRVYVDEFKPFDLRSSVGAGLKFLTPVGSLDFDYGFKLQRETYSGNKRDSAGRFHLSIGFF